MNNNDLFIGRHGEKEIKLKRCHLKQYSAKQLLNKLNKKNFNLSSGHEELKLISINDDIFLFRLITFCGGPTQDIYFEKLH